MIFAAAKTEPTVFLFLSEKDIEKIKEGRTLFIDERATQDYRFSKVIIAYSETDKQAADLLTKMSGINHEEHTTHEPRGFEKKCGGCEGLMPIQQLFEGRCIVCWATLAKKALRR